MGWFRPVSSGKTRNRPIGGLRRNGANMRRLNLSGGLATSLIKLASHSQPKGVGQLSPALQHQLLADQLEQRGLAGAVAPDQPDLVALGNIGAGPLEKGAAFDGIADVGDTQAWAGNAAAGRWRQSRPDALSCNDRDRTGSAVTVVCHRQLSPPRKSCALRQMVARRWPCQGARSRPSRPSARVRFPCAMWWLMVPRALTPEGVLLASSRTGAPLCITKSNLP